MVSADATPGQIDRLIAAGAHDYLTKPFDLARLVEVLESWFERAEQKQ
jgi:CheY-like chemotaxis protein